MTIPASRPAWNWRRRRARKLLADHDVRRRVRELIAHVDQTIEAELLADQDRADEMRARDEREMEPVDA